MNEKKTTILQTLFHQENIYETIMTAYSSGTMMYDNSLPEMSARDEARATFMINRL